MLNILDVKQYDVVNGPGIRCSIWLSGCSNHCKGCWSPHTWNATTGDSFQTKKKLITKFINNPRIDGISILGGDPFYWLYQNSPEEKMELRELLALCKKSGKPLWLWTGYLYEDLVRDYPEYLKYLDILIDGRFEESLKDLKLYWRGSSNQRIINVQESLRNKIVIKERL